MWCLFWNKYLLCIRPKRLTWYLEGKRCSNQPDDAFAAHTSTQLPQDGVHSECPPTSPSLSHRHKCCRVRLSGGWEGMIGTHKFEQCTAAERMWPHPGRAHDVFANCFFCFFLCSLVPGRKQVDVTSSQSVTITSRLICKLGCCGCFKREWKQWGIFIFFLLVTFLFHRQETLLHVVLLVIKVAAKEVIQQHCPQRIMQVKATVLYSTINQPAACWCPWRERTKLGKLHKKTTKSFIEPNTKKCEPPLHPRRSHSSCSTAMNASVVLPKRNERQWGLVRSRPCSNRVHPLLPRSPTAPRAML